MGFLSRVIQPILCRRMNTASFPFVFFISFVDVFVRNVPFHLLHTVTPHLRIAALNNSEDFVSKGLTK